MAQRPRLFSGPSFMPSFWRSYSQDSPSLQLKGTSNAFAPARAALSARAALPLHQEGKHSVDGDARGIARKMPVREEQMLTRWLSILALGTLGVTLAFFQLGRMALLDPDEARFAETSREMIERADYAVPYFNGEPRLKKPPLLHWEHIAAFKLLGVSEYAARLPSAFASLALLAALVAFARLECGWSVALRAGAILLTCPLAFVAGRMVLIDMTLALFVCSSLFLYYLADSGRIGAGAGSAAMGLLLGTALLAKGPVGVLVPAVVIAGYHLAMREGKPFTRWRRILPAGAIAAAMSAPWLVLVVHRVGYETFEKVAFRETVERYVSTGLEHPQGPWYYFVITGLAAFPWSAFLLPSYLTGIKRYLLPGWRRRGSGTDRLGVFLWMWIAGVIIFFSLGKGKLATYILPVMPAAALYLAREWQRASEPGAEDPPAERLTRLEWCAGLALLAPIVIVAFVAMRWNPVHASSFLGYAAPFGLMSGGSIGAALLLSRRTRRWVVVPVLTACVSAFYIYVIAASGGELEHERSLKSMVLETRLEQRPDVRLCVYRDFRPSLVFYARRHVERADNLGELQAFLHQPGEEVVVMDTDRLAGLG